MLDYLFQHFYSTLAIFSFCIAILILRALGKRISFWIPVSTAPLGCITFLAVFLLQRLLIKRITRTPETAKEAGKTLEEPEAIPEEIPALEEKKEADERLDVLEELLGRIQEENTGEESLDVEEALKKAREIYERSEEVPDDLTAEEANLDVEETLKELEAKEEYTEEDARKLVLALKKKLREE